MSGIKTQCSLTLSVNDDTYVVYVVKKYKKRSVSS